jgi:parallel beta-helix repeat protein
MTGPFHLEGHYPRRCVRIDSNADFDSSHGINGGSGTVADPWRISGWRFDEVGSGFGIFVGNTTEPFAVEDCAFVRASGAYSNPWYPMAGVTFYNVSGGAVEGCVFSSELRDGALFDTTVGCSFTGNEVRCQETGLLVKESSGATVTGNDFAGCEAGCNLDLSRGCELVGNAFADNTCGLRLERSVSNVVDNCTFDGNVAGLVLFHSNDNTVVNNTIAGSVRVKSSPTGEPDDQGQVWLTAGPEPPSVLSSRPVPEVKNQETLAGVPPYIWYRGCGPTSAGMVLGYWDTKGYDGLMTGDAGNFTQGVKDAISSQGNWDDYCLPLDSNGNILPDRSELPDGDEHLDDSIADCLNASRSRIGAFFGACEFWSVDDGIVKYVNHASDDYLVRAANRYYTSMPWADVCAEIGSGHPMVASVDITGDTVSDHLVAMIGYGEWNGTRMYQCWNTWDDDCSDDWYEYVPTYAGQEFSVYGFISVRLDVNGFGAYLGESEGNVLHHNTFSGNSCDARDDGDNAWDGGYPSGGNRWGNYTGLDVYSGAYQNLPGSDGMGDTPEGICDGTNLDRYPLVERSAGTLTNFQIPVVQGWNLVSIPLDMPFVDFSAQLQDGDTLWDRAMWYNPASLQHPWVQFNSLWPPEMNGLPRVETAMGFWLNVTDAGDGYLNVTGYLRAATSVPLRAGWNLMGYPADDDSTHTIGMLRAATGATVVEGFSSAAIYNTQVLEDSYVMKRGEGYWVYVPTDIVWTVDW